MAAGGKRVLVTGAGGFVGGHVARDLAASGYSVRGFARRPPPIEPGDPPIDWMLGDLREPAALKRAVAGAWGVVHCASWVRLGVDPRGRSRAVNVEATRSLLAVSASEGVERFVYTSTLQTLAAGTPDRPADEDSPWNLATVRSPYTETKRAAEALVLEGCGGRLATVALCPGMVVGPRDPGPSSTKVLLVMSRSRTAVLPGGGIPMLDSRVAAVAHRRALEGTATGRRYAVVGAYVSFRDQAELVAKVSGRPRRIVKLADGWEPWARGLAGGIDRATGGRWASISRATVSGGFLRFHVSGARADAAFGLDHPPPIESIYRALQHAKRAGQAPWLGDLAPPG